MIGLVRRLLTPHRPRHDEVGMKLTDPEEKREAEERAKEARRLVWLLEEQARAMALGDDDGKQT